MITVPALTGRLMLCGKEFWSQELIEFIYVWSHLWFECWTLILEPFSMRSGDTAALPLIPMALNHVFGCKNCVLNNVIVRERRTSGFPLVWNKSELSPFHHITEYVLSVPTIKFIISQIDSCGHSDTGTADCECKIRNEATKVYYY